MTKPERYKKLFGEVAMEMGFITADELYDGLDEQKGRRTTGLQDKRIGQILLEQGALSMDQIQIVLDVVYPIDKEISR